MFYSIGQFFSLLVIILYEVISHLQIHLILLCDIVKLYNLSVSSPILNTKHIIICYMLVTVFPHTNDCLINKLVYFQIGLSSISRSYVHSSLPIEISRYNRIYFCLHRFACLFFGIHYLDLVLHCCLSGILKHTFNYGIKLLFFLCFERT